MDSVGEAGSGRGTLRNSARMDTGAMPIEGGIPAVVARREDIPGLALDCRTGLQTLFAVGEEVLMGRTEFLSSNLYRSFKYYARWHRPLFADGGGARARGSSTPPGRTSLHSLGSATFAIGYWRMI
jgi:hypothetical protein